MATYLKALENWELLRRYYAPPGSIDPQDSLRNTSPDFNLL